MFFSPAVWKQSDNSCQQWAEQELPKQQGADGFCCGSGSKIHDGKGFVFFLIA